SCSAAHLDSPSFPTRRSSDLCLIGVWMGITPAGATPASFMSYGLAKRLSRNGHLFGTGRIEGVIAPETAAHAAGTSALLPMLTLDRKSTRLNSSHVAISYAVF